MTAPPRVAKTPILQVERLTKSFPGVKALDGIDFELRPGEVHAVVGENGAGKSTLMHILGGVYKPDSGVIRLGGERVSLRNAHDAAARGVAIVFQELSLSPNLSVAENIFANRQPVRGRFFVDRRKLNAETEKLLRLFDADFGPDALAKRISAAHQQVVEILKAVSHRPKVLILDEPTSSLTAVETKLLFENIRRMRREGASFIYISHNLPEIFEIADRVTVLRDGKRVVTANVPDVDEDQLVKWMVGRELANMYGERKAPIGREFFRVEGAGRGKDFREVSFSLREGEIVGVAGLVGAGRTQLGRGLFGAEPLDAGSIYMDGRGLKIRSPRDAIRNRIAYLTEDRREQGLFLRMAIRANCIAPSLARFAGSLGIMDERAIREFAETSKTRFGIVAPSVEQRVRNLSGGNQQKVLLAMWMGIEPRVLIADEPTRGVDVGAKSEIYRLLRGLAATGAGVIMISSDLPEILGVSDRALVMRRGRPAGEFGRERATEEAIVACAAGVEAKEEDSLGDGGDG